MLVKNWIGLELYGEIDSLCCTVLIDGRVALYKYLRYQLI